ncbi:hypothetical protein CAMRE0001_2089 [Campylobacter rectus RM3267]|uniref:Uncharacterized protein n=1 Tax=Campylobacter rectus RM3267 TaxID=553218 RepID=B9D4N0_CAMRE|nr:hypothetical protein CAMRE0001_2089 [Campylobacter rectus RM3267]
MVLWGGYTKIWLCATYMVYLRQGLAYNTPEFYKRKSNLKEKQ